MDKALGLRDLEPSTPFFEVESAENWFADICEDLKITDPTAVFSQIETWMAEGRLLSDFDPAYKNTAALKSFLRRAITAANQAIQEPKKTKNDPLYHKLERSELYRKIYGIDPQAAKSILIFAAARKGGSQNARLEIEVGRWGAFLFQAPLDNYFYRQSDPRVSASQKQDNGILARSTGKKPQQAQYALVQSASLQNLGHYLIERRDFNVANANPHFTQSISENTAHQPHLHLINFANLAGQLQTYCPQIFEAAQSIIAASVKRESSPEMNLYFLGSIMREARQSLGIAEKIEAVSGIETNQDFQARLQSLLEQNGDSYTQALEQRAVKIDIQPQIIDSLI